jgi:hypothetical protein
MTNELNHRNSLLHQFGPLLNWKIAFAVLFIFLIFLFFYIAPENSKISISKDGVSLEKGSPAISPASEPLPSSDKQSKAPDPPPVNIVSIEVPTTSAPSVSTVVVDIADWALPKKIPLKESGYPVPLLDGSINVSFTKIYVTPQPLFGIAIGGVNTKKLKVAVKSAHGEPIPIYKDPFGMIWTDWLWGVKFDIEYLGQIFEISVTEAANKKDFTLFVKRLQRSGLELKTFDELRSFSH